MHIQDRVDMVIKFMLPGTDLLHQLFQRLDIETVHLQFLFLVPDQVAAQLPVHGPPDDPGHDQDKHNDHFHIQGAAEHQVRHQIQADHKRYGAQRPV